MALKFGFNYGHEWHASQTEVLSSPECDNNHCVFEVNKKTRRIYGNLIERHAASNREIRRVPFMTDHYFPVGPSQPDSLKGLYLMLRSCTYPIPFHFGPGFHE